MAKALPYVVASWRLPSIISRDDVSLLGGKAVGLLRLPSEWVPSFIVFTSQFYGLLKTGTAREAFKLVPLDEFNLVRDFLSSLSNSSLRTLVRSNSPTEGQTATPGKYLSKVTDADSACVADAIDQICNIDTDNIVYCLVQECVEPAMIGHMSNERRVSPERSIWLVEGLAKMGPTKLRTHKDEDNASLMVTNASLMATSENGVLKALRRVAKKLITLEQGYYHCEWAWTGNRVWIVQSDSRPPTIATPAVNKYIYSVTRETEPFMPSSSKLYHFLNVPENRWKKLKRPLKFHELGLPHADIFLLTGEDWDEGRSKNFVNLLPDLENMCREPVIVRCDIADYVQEEDLFLPTSSPTTNPDNLIQYMGKISKYFTDKSIEERSWAFLLARVVQAKASALIYARPETQMVQIDALWGYPDGLLYYPHNTYYYDCRDGKITEKRCFKGFSLICTDEAWITLPVNPPLDWGHVLSTIEVEVLANWALSLVNNLGHEIQLMALARVSGHRGQSGCLPWHYTQLEISPRTAITQHATRLAPMRVIRSREDLNKLQMIIDSSERVSGFLVQPDEGTLRDAVFLHEAATLATKAGIPIYFEGSLLGHTYYKMAMTGATVIPLSEVRPSPRIIRYEKIVRDLIPAIIRRAGGIARVRTLSRDEAITLLAQKLIEESFEVWQSDPKRLASELADMLEVIDALQQYAAISTKDLDKIRENKREQRGGFQDLIFLEETINQPLQLVGDQTGTVPLFMEDVITSTQVWPKSRILSDQLITTELDQGPEETIKITVPLVPPVKRGHKMNKVTSRSGEHSIQVVYNKSQLVVTISPIVEEPPYEQLRLFPDIGEARED